MRKKPMSKKMKAMKMARGKGGKKMTKPKGGKMPAAMAMGRSGKSKRNPMERMSADQIEKKYGNEEL